MPLASFKNRRVLVTGHTGFKGAWLTQWLTDLGAQVWGYSLASPTSPALYQQLNLEDRIESIEADVRDSDRLSAVVRDWKPEFVFHLAAQSLVRPSYAAPEETFSTNVMGTVNLLNALRLADTRCAAVIVTSDKCYQNKEWIYSYREADPLGGFDPYSCSKAMAELATESFRQSFFAASPIRVASARAGNVIGGGDWAVDRILPDCIRALLSNAAIQVRNPHARRPWQHVLEPLAGYLRLALKLDGVVDEPGNPYCSAFNFGPAPASNRTVLEVVQQVLVHWPGEWYNASNHSAPHEATLLALASDKAAQLLEWSGKWNFEQTIQHTVEWYALTHQRHSPVEITQQQIRSYQKIAF
ncbi:CDP-glucose 4,6-dehydratase [Aureliella helgolandensis]|uniref:CDP-glucose 4,6-dehydratase n=1 Tax=Aureliella helgolandensis TaxID=2527968 RepID=UPI0018D0F8D4|nr:CDP-glucose 4,6-dehydratase [Aureliella helgolandensis]